MTDHIPITIFILFIIGSITFSNKLIAKNKSNNPDKNFGCMSSLFVHLVVFNLISLSIPFLFISIAGIMIFLFSKQYLLIPVLFIVLIACLVMLSVLWGGVLYIQGKSYAPAAKYFNYLIFNVMVPCMILGFTIAISAVSINALFLDINPSGAPKFIFCIFALLIPVLLYVLVQYCKDTFLNNK